MQISKLKFGIKNSTEVTLELSLSVVGDSNDENNFPHKLLLTNTQLSRFIKLLQIIPQLIQSYQKLIYIKLGLLLKTGFPLMKNVLKPLAKSVLIILGSTAAASATDAGICKKCLDRV